MIVFSIVSINVSKHLAHIQYANFKLDLTSAFTEYLSSERNNTLRHQCMRTIFCVGVGWYLGVQQLVTETYYNYVSLLIVLLVRVTIILFCKQELMNLIAKIQ